MPDLIPILDRLTQLGSPNGGWGYSAGQAPHLEPTCFATLALDAIPDRYPGWIEAGLRAIAANAAANGGYRLERGRHQAVWPTALVLLLRHALGHKPADLVPIVDRLLAVAGRPVQKDPEFADIVDIDMQLIGWPWAEGTFSWVEPTAWAIVALRACGRGGETRVQEGLRLLLDRAYDHGGTNYGNKTVLGKATDPIPGPTAVLLLACQGLAAEPRVAAAISYLRSHALATADLDHLAWAKLALSCYPDDPANRDALAKLDAKIAESLDREANAGTGLSAGPMRVSLAALALDCGRRHPFRLTDAPQVAAAGSLAEIAAAVDRDAKSLGGKVASTLSRFFAGGFGRLRPPPPTSAVHIAKCESYDGPMLDVLKSQFEHFRKFVPIAGKRVVLKPNLVEWHRDKVINTDPRFVGAVIDLFRAEGAAEVIVAEGPGHWRNVQFLVNESGLGDVLRSRNVPFVDINHDEPVKTLNLGKCTGLDHLYLSKTVASADVLVSLPKLKTHHWAGVTLSLKNLFGTLPGSCYGWPKNELHWRGIPNSIIDIALTQTPHLAIIDGIVGMEGDGPLMGTPKHVGAIVMGCDLVAVDATGARLMGIDPARIATLVLGLKSNLGQLAAERIPQLGELIASVAQTFALPPNAKTCLLAEPMKLG